MDKLKIAYIQPNIVWEASSENLRKYDSMLSNIDEADLIILPEMFNTGFTMNVNKVAQSTNGMASLWLKKYALERNCAIMGSTIVKDQSKFYNRFMMAFPCSNIQHYNKRHLFRMGNEHERFEPGTERVVFPFLGWRIKPQICYDLRFPVWSRNENNYDLLIYVANWPGARREVWITLLKARAIENQCYVVGVNRVGTDGMNISYTGDSMIINPRGEIISELPINEEGIGYAEISLSELQSFRKKFPVHLDADQFEILD